MNFKPFFDQINLKVQLTKEEEDIIAARLKKRSYLKGQYVVQDGDVYRYQTFILSGMVRTFYLDHDGNEHVISFGMENWWTGDLCSFTTQTPAEFNTQCLEKTTVVQIAYDDMEILYREVPKLERYFRVVIQKAYGNMTKRIVRNHSMSARERYLLFTQMYPDIAQGVPQYMIASYLGITKEFLSRMRKKIAEEARS